MTAAVLRDAASKMRACAEAATPGVWKLWGMTVMADQDGTSNVDTAVPVADTFWRDENGKPRTWDAQHIASWGPVVALAVADWLEAEVPNAEFREGQSARDNEWRIREEPFPTYYDKPTLAAIRVARAYLGVSV